MKIINNKFKCEDCESEVIIPKDVENGEIVSCKSCGCEYYIWKTSEGLKINRLELEGIDYGEIIGLFKLKGKDNVYRRWKRLKGEIKF